MQLRDHQVRAVAAVRAQYVAGKRAVLLVMPCGAGKTVTFAEIGRLVVAKGGRVLVLAHTTELVTQAVAKLAALGVPADIEQAGQHATTAVVVVASIATMRGERLARWAPDTFTLIVHDEAHRTATETSRAILAHFVGAFLLGVTATPMRGDERAMGDTYQALVVGATIRELVAAGHLVPARVFAPAADLKAGMLAMTPAAAYERHGAGQRAIVFCANREHAAEIAASMPVPAAIVHGEMPDAERAAVLARFRSGEIRVLTNVHLLSEGFDDPEVAVVILARRLGSPGTYLQCVGRALRPAPGKLSATIVDLAGSVLEHGLPDEERVFSLEGKPIRTSDRLALRQCMACGAVSEATDECSECGTPFPFVARSSPRSADVGVSEVDPTTPRKPWVTYMQAKRGGLCVDCHRGIRIGEPIQWSKQLGAAHALCSLVRKAA